jgi:hypothetical protein
MARQVVKLAILIILALFMMGLHEGGLGTWILTSGEEISVPCPVHSSDPMKLPKECPAPSPLVCLSPKAYTEEVVEIQSLRRQVDQLTRERDQLKESLRETIKLAERANEQTLLEKLTIGAVSCGVCAGGGVVFRSSW